MFSGIQRSYWCAWRPRSPRRTSKCCLPTTAMTMNQGCKKARDGDRVGRARARGIGIYRARARARARG